MLEGGVLAAVAAFFFVDLLDTAGTLLGVGLLGGFVDRDGNLPRANRAFAADATATAVGACLGTSTVTSYIESATGIEEGGRTGLTALTVAALFLGRSSSRRYSSRCRPPPPRPPWWWWARS